ncbi:MAG: glycosyltransferase family 2 protein [Pseudomonadota bacterium]
MTETRAGDARPPPELREPRPSPASFALIIPCHNEAGSLRAFMTRLGPVLEAHADDRFELIFINDGSTDATLAELVRLRASDRRITLIDLSRRFGKEAAITAGLDYAEADAVIPIDADLQDPPELISSFIEHWRDGYDMVYGLRRSRGADSPAKRVTAKAFYRTFNQFSETPIPEDAGDFRLMDRRVVDAVNRLPERNRFMKGLVAWVGFSAIAVAYDRPARAKGRTKFSFSRLWNFALDGLVGFSAAPIKIWTYIGLGFAVLALVYAVYLILRTLLFGVDVPGYASIMVVLLVVSALQMISVGVQGEYLGRLFIEAKQRPIYIVRDILKCDDDDEADANG